MFCKTDWVARFFSYISAVSMWRYPASSAVNTAFSCSSWSCQVPRPMAGISAPVLSLNFVGEAAMVCKVRLRYRIVVNGKRKFFFLWYVSGVRK